MNQGAIHPADCSCSKCRDHFGTSQQRRRFIMVMILYMAILVAAGTAMIIAASPR